MEEILTRIPGWSNEISGFNQGTVILLIGIILAAFLAKFLASYIITRFLSPFCKGHALAEESVVESRGSLGTAAGSAVVFLALKELSSAESSMMPLLVQTWGITLAQLVMLFTLIIWMFRLVGIVHAIVAYVDDDDELDSSEKTLITALESVMRFLIVIFGAIFIADALGFELSTLIAGLGITGIALALAAKDTISNLFGAITVLLDRPFKVGDWVVIGSAEGEVIDIGLRTTLIRTGVDTIITMPNANLTNTPVENWGKRRWRRYSPLFQFDINSDPEDVRVFCDNVLEKIQNHPKTLKEDASWVNVAALGPLAIDVDCNMYWDISSGKEEREARDEFLLDVMNAAKELNLEFHDARIRTSR